MRAVLFYITVYSVLLIVSSTPEQPSLTFEELYSYGKSEYTNENWQECVAFMLRALEDFYYYRDETLWCREKCHREVDRLPEYTTQVNDLELAMLEITLVTAQNALCLLRCRVDRFTEDRPPMSEYSIYEDFVGRKPYHYLQFCYWKQRDIRNAVKSAYTFLVANPDDQDTLDNLKFYMNEENYDPSYLVDSQQMKYEKFYMAGVQAYEEKDWMQCVDDFDHSQREFFQELEKCRLFCEDFLDWGTMQGDNPEMSIVMTSIFTSVLRCKTKCVDGLSKVNGYRIKNFLSSYFEYLHVCQFNLQRGRDAAQSVTNALLLDGNNIIMRRNRLFYSNHYNTDTIFKPSQKIVDFVKRQRLEQRFVEFVDNRFQYKEGILPSYEADDKKPFSYDTGDFEDYFDYSRLARDLLASPECDTLKSAAQLPASMSSRSFIPLLIQEIGRRINEQYGSEPTFESLTCHKTATTSGCARGALVISVDKETCSAVLAEEFAGCAVIFCTS